MNVNQAAAQVIKDAGEPLHVTEITRRILRSGLWQSKGKTPAALSQLNFLSAISERSSCVNETLDVKRKRK